MFSRGTVPWMCTLFEHKAAAAAEQGPVYEGLLPAPPRAGRKPACADREHLERMIDADSPAADSQRFL